MNQSALHRFQDPFYWGHSISSLQKIGRCNSPARLRTGPTSDPEVPMLRNRTVLPGVLLWQLPRIIEAVRNVSPSPPAPTS